MPRPSKTKRSKKSINTSTKPVETLENIVRSVLGTKKKSKSPPKKAYDLEQFMEEQYDDYQLKNQLKRVKI